MRIASIFMVLAFAAAACGGKSKPADGGGSAAADTRSLYERLGGTPAITAVVEEFVTTTGADPRISMFFTNADIPKLKATMVEHICSITGGPCTYKGKSMKESHTGMKVREEHFVAFQDDLAKTLDKLNVPAREKSEVLAAFEGMKADIVEPAP
jgi:hemoglobin